eukprot:GHVP01003624.1.p1 GENE.GHVP01003624.1~~GHVP01003624.1.p1  ORF type:complete len:3413 (+),score=705.66 GHVP01003624.1:5288-15526(+)
MTMLSSEILGISNLWPAMHMIWNGITMIKKGIHVQGNEVYFSKKQSVGQEFDTEDLEYIGSLKNTNNDSNGDVLWDYCKRCVKENITALLDEKKEGGPSIRLPEYFKGFITETHLDNWIDMGIYALFGCESKRDYLLEGEVGIVPVDYKNTGVMQHSVQWNYGLQQFLQLKHRAKLSNESFSSNYCSNITFFNKYSTIFGVTGTLGEDYAKAFLKNIYKVESIIIPPFKTKMHIEMNSSLERTPMNWKEKILRQIKLQIELERPMLIIVESIKVATDLYEITKKYIDSNIEGGITRFDIRKYFAEEDTTDAKRTLNANTIMIATNISGRGMDLEVPDEIEENGGLHIIVTFMPDSERVLRQNIGRTSRKGQRGSSQFIILSQSRSFEALIEEKKERSRKLFEEAEKSAQKMQIKDDIFLEYLGYKNKLENNTSKYRKPNILELEESFAMWMVKYEKLQKDKEKNEEIIIPCFDEFKQDFEEFSLGRNRNTPKNIYIMYSEANQYIKNGSSENSRKMAENIYNSIIKEEKFFHGNALYNLAYILLKRHPDLTKEEKIGNFKDIESKLRGALIEINHQADVLGSLLDYSVDRIQETRLQIQISDKKALFEIQRNSIESVIGIGEEEMKKEIDSLERRAKDFKLSFKYNRVKIKLLCNIVMARESIDKEQGKKLKKCFNMKAQYNEHKMEKYISGFDEQKKEMISLQKARIKEEISSIDVKIEQLKEEDKKYTEIIEKILDASNSVYKTINDYDTKEETIWPKKKRLFNEKEWINLFYTIKKLKDERAEYFGILEAEGEKEPSGVDSLSEGNEPSEVDALPKEKVSIEVGLSLLEDIEGWIYNKNNFPAVEKLKEVKVCLEDLRKVNDSIEEDTDRIDIRNRIKDYTRYFKNVNEYIRMVVDKRILELGFNKEDHEKLLEVIKIDEERNKKIESNKSLSEERLKNEKEKGEKSNILSGYESEKEKLNKKAKRIEEIDSTGASKTIEGLNTQISDQKSILEDKKLKLSEQEKVLDREKNDLLSKVKQFKNVLPGLEELFNTEYDWKDAEGLKEWLQYWSNLYTGRISDIAENQKGLKDFISRAAIEMLGSQNNRMELMKEKDPYVEKFEKASMNLEEARNQLDKTLRVEISSAACLKGAELFLQSINLETEKKKKDLLKCGKDLEKENNQMKIDQISSIETLEKSRKEIIKRYEGEYQNEVKKIQLIMEKRVEAQKVGFIAISEINSRIDKEKAKINAQENEAMIGLDKEIEETISRLLSTVSSSSSRLNEETEKANVIYSSLYDSNKEMFNNIKKVKHIINSKEINYNTKLAYSKEIIKEINSKEKEIQDEEKIAEKGIDGHNKELSDIKENARNQLNAKKTKADGIHSRVSKDIANIKNIKQADYMRSYNSLDIKIEEERKRIIDVEGLIKEINKAQRYLSDEYNQDAVSRLKACANEINIPSDLWNGKIASARINEFYSKCLANGNCIYEEIIKEENSLRRAVTEQNKKFGLKSGIVEAKEDLEEREKTSNRKERIFRETDKYITWLEKQERKERKVERTFEERTEYVEEETKVENKGNWLQRLCGAITNAFVSVWKFVKRTFWVAVDVVTYAVTFSYCRLKRENEEYFNNYRSWKRAAKEHQEVYDRLDTISDHTESELGRIQRRIIHSLKLFSELQGFLEEKKKGLSEQIEEYRGRIDGLNHDKPILLEEAKDNYKKEVERNINTVNGSKIEMENLIKESAKDKEKAIEDINTHNADIKEFLLKVDSGLKEKQEQIEKDITNLKNIKEDLSKEKTLIEEAQESISSYYQSISANRKRVLNRINVQEGIYSEIFEDTKDTQYQERKNTIDSLQKKEEEIRDGFKQLKEEVGSLQEQEKRIGGAFALDGELEMGDYSNGLSEGKGIRSPLEELEGNITALSLKFIKDKKYIESSIKKIESQILDLENHLKSIKSEVLEIKRLVSTNTKKKELSDLFIKKAKEKVQRSEADFIISQRNLEEFEAFVEQEGNDISQVRLMAEERATEIRDLELNEKAILEEFNILVPTIQGLIISLASLGEIQKEVSIMEAQIAGLLNKKEEAMNFLLEYDPTSPLIDEKRKKFYELIDRISEEYLYLNNTYNMYFKNVKFNYDDGSIITGDDKTKDYTKRKDGYLGYFQLDAVVSKAKLKVSIEDLDNVRPQSIPLERLMREFELLRKQGYIGPIKIDEINRINWGRFFARLALGLAQFAGGIALSIFSAGSTASFSIGMALEGITDIFSTCKGEILDGSDFSWKDWAIDKAISYTISSITAGWGTMKDVGKTIFAGAKGAVKFGASAAKFGINGLKGVAKSCLKNISNLQALYRRSFTALTRGVISYGIRKGCQMVAKSTIENVINTVAENFLLTRITSFLVSLFRPRITEKVENLFLNNEALKRLLAFDVKNTTVEMSMKIKNYISDSFIVSEMGTHKRKVVDGVAKVGHHFLSMGVGSILSKTLFPDLVGRMAETLKSMKGVAGFILRFIAKILLSAWDIVVSKGTEIVADLVGHFRKTAENAFLKKIETFVATEDIKKKLKESEVKDDINKEEKTQVVANETNTQQKRKEEIKLDNSELGGKEEVETCYADRKEIEGLETPQKFMIQKSVQNIEGVLGKYMSAVMGKITSEATGYMYSKTEEALDKNLQKIKDKRLPMLLKDKNSWRLRKHQSKIPTKGEWKAKADVVNERSNRIEEGEEMIGPDSLDCVMDAIKSEVDDLFPDYTDEQKKEVERILDDTTVRFREEDGSLIEDIGKGKNILEINLKNGDHWEASSNAQGDDENVSTDEDAYGKNDSLPKAVLDSLAKKGHLAKVDKEKVRNLRTKTAENTRKRAGIVRIPGTKQIEIPKIENRTAKCYRKLNKGYQETMNIANKNPYSPVGGLMKVKEQTTIQKCHQDIDGHMNNSLNDETEGTKEEKERLETLKKELDEINTALKKINEQLEELKKLGSGDTYKKKALEARVAELESKRYKHFYTKEAIEDHIGYRQAERRGQKRIKFIQQKLVNSETTQAEILVLSEALDLELARQETRMFHDAMIVRNKDGEQIRIRFFKKTDEGFVEDVGKQVSLYHQQSEGVEGNIMDFVRTCRSEVEKDKNITGDMSLKMVTTVSRIVQNYLEQVAKKVECKHYGKELDKEYNLAVNKDQNAANVLDPTDSKNKVAAMLYPYRDLKEADFLKKVSEVIDGQLRVITQDRIKGYVTNTVSDNEKTYKPKPGNSSREKKAGKIVQLATERENCTIQLGNNKSVTTKRFFSNDKGLPYNGHYHIEDPILRQEKYRKIADIAHSNNCKYINSLQGSGNNNHCPQYVMYSLLEDSNDDKPPLYAVHRYVSKVGGGFDFITTTTHFDPYVHSAYSLQPLYSGKSKELLKSEDKSEETASWRKTVMIEIIGDVRTVYTPNTEGKLNALNIKKDDVVKSMS